MALPSSHLCFQKVLIHSKDRLRNSHHLLRRRKGREVRRSGWAESDSKAHTRLDSEQAAPGSASSAGRASGEALAVEPCLKFSVHLVRHIFLGFVMVFADFKRNPCTLPPMKNQTKQKGRGLNLAEPACDGEPHIYRHHPKAKIQARSKKTAALTASCWP